MTAPSHVKTSTYQTVVTVAIAVTALYVARDVLLPLALAALLAFLLLPIVRRLERYRMRRVPAVFITMAAVVLLGASTFYHLGEQVVELAARLPEYRQHIHEKLGAAKGFVNPLRERVEEASRVVADLANSPAPQAPAAPVPSESEAVSQDDSSRHHAAMTLGEQDAQSTISLLRDWLLPFISPLATGAAVAIFTIFMLIEWEDLRNRLIVLCGVNRVPGTTEALEEAAARVSRYLRMQVLINSIYGLGLGTTCWLAGLPNPLLWGALGGLWRFVPYAGAVVGASLPILLAVAVADSWTLVIALAVVVIAMELIAGNVLEPWLYGTSTGVSPSGILVSAFFWTWLWGPVGLLLATPLTVVLTIMGRQVPPLRFVTTLFSDEPPLSSAARLYQRLLAHDTYEVMQILEDEVRQQRSPVEVADSLLQSLSQAVSDTTHGVLSEERLTGLVATLQEVDGELPELFTPDAWPTNSITGQSLIIAPARTEVDEEAARIIGAGISGSEGAIQTLHRVTMASDLAREIAASSAEALIICGVGPHSARHCRYLLRHLHLVGWHRPIYLTLLGLTNAKSELFESRSDEEQLIVTHSAFDLLTKLVHRESRLAAVSSMSAS